MYIYIWVGLACELRLNMLALVSVKMWWRETTNYSYNAVLEVMCVVILCSVLDSCKSKPIPPSEGRWSNHTSGLWMGYWLWHWIDSPTERGSKTCGPGSNSPLRSRTCGWVAICCRKPWFVRSYLCYTADYQNGSNGPLRCSSESFAGRRVRRNPSSIQPWWRR